jgi:RNA polymerase sigma-70 factor (ECF subfamily)
VYVECARFVWLSLQRLGVRHADLDDVCHDVFIIVQRKLHEFDQRASLRPWLFGICARTAANYRRKSYIQRERSVGSFIEDEALLPPSDNPTPDRELDRREALTQAEAILGAMSPIKRAVFVMFEVEALSCQEIADELGVPVGTVYSRLHTARKFFLAQAQKGSTRGSAAR